MNTLNQQLQDTVARHGGLFAEHAIGHGDYLLVHFDACEQGLVISADFECETYFSGEVIETPTGFIVPFDPEYHNDIEHYLLDASEEITEGYLCPHNLRGLEASIDALLSA